MKIRTKALFIISATFLAFLAALLTFTGTILVTDYKKIEAVQVKRDVARARNFLAEAKKRLSVLCKDYAVWDDAYEYARNGGEDFVESNFVDSTFATQTINFVIIADHAGHIRFSRLFDLEAGQSRALPREILDAFRRPGLLALTGEPGQLSRAGLLPYHGGVLLAAVEPILRSDASGPAAGVCVMGRFFNEKFIENLSETTLLRIRAEILTNPGMLTRSIIPDALLRGKAEVSEEGGETLVGRFLVRDMLDVPIMVLAVTEDRSFFRMINKSAEYFAGLTLLAAFTLTLLAGVLLERLIIRRIQAVGQAVGGIARGKKLAVCLPVSGNDEIAVLSKEINSLLKSLGQAEKEGQVRAEELRRARDAADHASRTKSEFLAKMNHEIRTPINAIAGMIDAVLREPSPSDRREYLGMILDAADQLQGIIGEALDISRIEAGRLELRCTDFDLHLLARSVMRGANARAEAKGLSLRVSISKDAPRLANGDPGRLRQVLANLVLNAVKFTEKGEITLRLENLNAAQSRPGKIGVFFEVADTGHGIPKDKLEGIFENFVQAGEGADKKYGGAGLGLSIAKQLVELMGGEIDVQSTPFEGSVFSFTTYFDPPKAPARLHQTAAQASPGPFASAEGHRLLLVEDNPANRKIVELYLKDLPLTIDVAENGEAALEKFFASSYDAVLMDMEMPVMDGYEATTRIRAWEKENAVEPTPILALTAHAWTAQRERCFACGCSAFLPKPVTRAKLHEALYAHLSASALLKETVPDSAWKEASEAAPIQGFLREPEPEELRVRVEPELRGLISGFIDSVQEDISDMRETLHAGNLPAMAFVGRSLKGAGKSYGFPFIGEAGVYIEQAAAGKKTVEAERALDVLERYLKNFAII
jgi:two-component system, sensor histidine kinase